MPDGQPGPLPPPPSPEEVDAIIEAVGPVQNVADAGSDIGSLIQTLPGSGTDAVGEGLQVQADMLNLGVNTASFAARAAQAYAEAQVDGFQAVFPPPGEAAAEVQANWEQVADVFSGGPPDQPP